MKELPKRKQLRLKEYDYTGNGMYFITICTEGRRCLLGEIMLSTPYDRPNDPAQTVGATLCGRPNDPDKTGYYGMVQDDDNK